MSNDITFNKLQDRLLRCPSCNGTYLHQTSYEIFDREEDAQEGNHVYISANDITIDRKMDENPSPRRSGMKIYFVCETCEDQPVLRIVQHKGQTFAQFD